MVNLCHASYSNWNPIHTGYPKAILQHGVGLEMAVIKTWPKHFNSDDSTTGNKSGHLIYSVLCCYFEIANQQGFTVAAFTYYWEQNRSQIV